MQGQGNAELKWQDALEVPGSHSAHLHRRGDFLREDLDSSSKTVPHTHDAACLHSQLIPVLK